MPWPAPPPVEPGWDRFDPRVAAVVEQLPASWQKGLLPLALLVGEAVTNVFHHVGRPPDGTPPWLRVRLAQDADAQVVLTVENSGGAKLTDAQSEHRAGLGTRLRPLTERLPKPLVPLLGRPIVTYALLSLRAAGIEEVVVNLHHRGERLRAALRHLPCSPRSRSAGPLGTTPTFVRT